MSGDRYIIGDQHSVHFLTFTVVDWISVFAKKTHKQVIVDSLNYCVANKNLRIYAWCLMSNHLHIIARTEEPIKLSSVIRDFKSYTAKSIIEKIIKEQESRRQWMLDKFEFAGKRDKRITKYKFWQESNHAIELSPFDHKMWEQRVDYIHNNPVKEEIVELPEQYLHSSAKDYCGEKGLVKIEFPE